MLRQADNKVEIEGILSEVKLEKTSYSNKATGQSTDCIRGSIIVRVEQEINKVMTTLEIPVHYFVNKYTKTGAENKNYASLNTFMSDAVSIAACGDIEKADRVRLTSANIVMNEYYDTRRNQIVSYPQIKGSFITRISKADCKPKATFVVEFAVGKMTEETNKDGETTGREIITAILPQYGETVDVVPFICASPNVINVIMSNWHEGDSVRASGKLNFTYKVEEYEEEVDFGEPNIKQRTVNISELIITGGNQNPLEDTVAFDAAELQKAMAKRKATHEEKKNKALSNTSATKSAATTTSSDLLSGF